MALSTFFSGHSILLHGSHGVERITYLPSFDLHTHHWFFIGQHIRSLLTLALLYIHLIAYDY